MKRRISLKSNRKNCAMWALGPDEDEPLVAWYDPLGDITPRLLALDTAMHKRGLEANVARHKRHVRNKRKRGAL